MVSSKLLYTNYCIQIRRKSTRMNVLLLSDCSPYIQLLYFLFRCFSIFCKASLDDLFVNDAIMLVYCDVCVRTLSLHRLTPIRATYILQSSFSK